MCHNILKCLHTNTLLLRQAGLARLEAALPSLARLSAWGCAATTPRPSSGGLRFSHLAAPPSPPTAPVAVHG